jgi:cytochrome b subunit of formate dehydrogenase
MSRAHARFQANTAQNAAREVGAGAGCGGGAGRRSAAPARESFGGPRSSASRLLGLAPWLVVLAGLALLGCGNGTKPPSTKRGAPEPTAWKPDVSVEALQKSVHASLDCSSCHRKAPAGASSGTPAESLGKAECTPCHDAQAQAYAKSVHGVAIDAGNQQAARCTNCHGAHEIRKAGDPDSWVFKLRLPITCGRCHGNPETARKLGISEPNAGSWYAESIHGRGLVDGLIVAPSCVDCHGGSHAIRRAKDPESTVSRGKIPDTCGKCHVGIRDVYDRSIHGKRLAEGNAEAPTCVGCHSAHKIAKPDATSFKLESDALCGRCHAARLARYRETYHGRASALGQPDVAACFDCHGHHDIQPSSDPASRLSQANRVATCRQCHADAPPNFAGYLAHGDHTDRANYPVLYWSFFAMTALLIGVFSFFGVHTLLWLLRTLIVYVRDPEAFREAKRLSRTEQPGKLFVRFRPVDRFCHLLVIVSFLLLVITGMPLKFYQTHWAQAIFAFLGGANVAAFLHRLGAVITFAYFAIHLSSIVGPLHRQWSASAGERAPKRLWRLLAFLFGPDSPLPRPQDLRDFWAQLKWFFGRGPRPQFDRWTYWEKFDYLAVFWGVAAIGLSGLVMWVPTKATLLLPGWAINIAHIIHSDEALLAAGFIFAFHFFNVHFRPEKFPIDSVIFSGRITEAEMLHERRRQYDRLKAAGTLDAQHVQDEWPRWRRILNPFGVTAFLIGLGLVVAIFLTMLSH